MAAMATATEQRRSRRRRREEARDAFVRAALDLVEEAPFKDVTVDEIARAAGASRPAFYVHFQDKRELLLAAVEEVSAALYEEADRWWHGEGEPAELVREAVEGVMRVYAENAKLMRVAIEVSTYDEEFRTGWIALAERFIAATAEHLRAEQEMGRVNRRLEPQSTAEALVWMTERCQYIYLGRGDREPDELTESLTAVWTAALYPGSI
jgi:AcrR family transcriptional regulator